MPKNLQKFKEILNEIKRLQEISALLEWDQENQMPVNAIKARSEQAALISQITHEKATSKEFGDLINSLFEGRDKLSDIDKRSIEVAKRSYDKVVKLPTNFVTEFTKARSLSQS